MGRVISPVSCSPALLKRAQRRIVVDLFFTSDGFTPEEDKSFASSLKESRAYIGSKRDTERRPFFNTPHLPGFDPIPPFGSNAGGVVSMTLWTEPALKTGPSVICRR